MTIEPWAFLTAFGLLLMLGAFLLWRLVRSTETLQWTDLVATNGILNAYKIGYWIGTGIGSWAVIKTTYMGDLDAGVFAGYLAYLGGVPVGMSAIRGRNRDARRRDVDDPDADGQPNRLRGTF